MAHFAEADIGHDVGVGHERGDEWTARLRQLPRCRLLGIRVLSLELGD